MRTAGMALALLAVASAAASAAEPSAAPGPIDLRQELRIPLTDGVSLAATAYLPRGATPKPCVFTLTPYTRASYHDRGVWFAAHGLPFLTVDVRGRGDSGGTFTPNLQEVADGPQVVEWLARQPWCNGKVAMWGGSYAGYDQWATAGGLPPHLATIVPAAAAYPGVDFPVSRGIIDPYARQWLLLAGGRASQAPLFADSSFWAAMARERFEAGAANAGIVDLFGTHSPDMATWFAHRDDADWWRRYNPSPAALAKLAIPVLTITGSYDDDQPGALAHYRYHLANASPDAAARHYLIIGPWNHAGTRTPQASFSGLTVGAPSLLDMNQLHLEWYRWTMDGGLLPAFLKGRVAYYLLGADEWRYAPTLAAVTGGRSILPLVSDGDAADAFATGRLGGMGKAARDSYVYDPRDVRDAALEATVDPEDATDQRLVLARTGRQLVYTSAPVAAPVDLAGFPRLRAWIAIDQPDADLRATLYAVEPDGRAVRLGADRIRARYRQGDFRPRLVSTRAPLLYEFDRFPFHARRLAAGTRLRLVIDPLNSIWAEKNYGAAQPIETQTLAGARPVRVTLFHDRGHPSALDLPIAAPNH